ncbi:MAG TPA: peptidylprolyl isomerase [Myxococcales bacterium]|jgi:peptidyl-prolyl cis-trans isomerase C
MSNKVTAVLAVVLIALAYYAGIRAGGAGSGAGGGGLLPVASRPGNPVATFDGVSISDSEIKGQIEEQAPFVRTRYSTPEGKKEFLDNLVRFELLAREAQKKNYQAEPDIIRQHKRNMVALFVQREFEEPQQKQVIPEDELKKYYEAHVADYQRPERVRAASVFFAAPAEDAAKRKAQKAAAEAALAELKEKEPKDYGAFAEMARAKSEDPSTKPSGGDLSFLNREDLAKRVGQEFAEAAFTMKEMGKVLDKVVETPQGFHLVKLLGREAALDLKFDNVKDSIKSRLIYERRSDAYKKFLEDLNKKANLTVNKEALDAIKIDAAAPPTPQVGALPPARRPMMPGQGAPMPPQGPLAPNAPPPPQAR